MIKLCITARIPSEGRTIAVSGRVAWALRELLDAGAQGCTYASHPAPRWSGYIHKLRQMHRLNIETRRVRHGGDFPGIHASYVLVSDIEIVRQLGGRTREEE